MTTGVACPPIILSFLDNAGRPNAGGYITTKVGGINHATYEDVGLTTPLPNPIPLNSRGEISNAAGTSKQLFLTPNVAYVFTMFDRNGNQLNQASTVEGLQLTGEQIAVLLDTVTDTPILNSLNRTAAEIAAGVTPANYTYQPGHILRYGAVLDGSTDDTTAVQRWALVGGDLVWPVVATAKVTSAITLVSDSTITAVEGATIRQYTTNASVMTATTKTNISVSGLKLYAVGSFSSITNGGGIIFNDCTDVLVDNVTVKNHRGAGVLFYNTQRGTCQNSLFIDSPVSDSDNHTQANCDVGIQGNSSYCKAINNRCISGQGVGVVVQSITAGDSCSYNLVHGNTVANCKQYGILAGYQNNNSDILEGNVYTSNILKNITGAVAHQTFGYVYGAGFYSTTCNDTIIANNSIDGTHTAPVIFVDQLAPGAIGVTVSGKMIITGNSIRNAHVYGITVRNPSGAGPAIAETIVSNNNLSNVTSIGIQILEKELCSVIGNTLDTIGGSGISVANTTTNRKGIKIDGNDVINITGTGILTSFTSGMTINGNTVDTTSVHGIYIQNADDSVVDGNTVLSHTTYGIYIDNTVTRYTMNGNLINGTGSSTYGYGLLARANTRGMVDPNSNAVNGCTTPWTGDFTPYYAADPVAGAREKGDLVLTPLASIASGGFMGRVCITAGTPGTWKTWGAIS